MDPKSEVNNVEDATPHAPKSRHVNARVVPMQQEAQEDLVHIDLTWRSWMVVFVSCFAIMAQVYVVVAAGSVIAFIVRDLGQPAISGWIIQGPLLMQTVLSPLVGRLSDVLDRKLFASIPPLIAVAGSIICAKATSMQMLIGGGILVGITLATISIVQSIPSEILPLKYRALANGFAFLGGAVGGLVGGLGAGAVTNVNPAGWRNIFWIMAGLHGATSLGFFAFYWPKKRTEYPRMSFKEYVWACDPIGSVLFISGATLMLLALNWAGGAYHWSDPHVCANLVVGIVLVLAFCVYEWKGRTDGMVAHVFFSTGPNFWLATFAFAVEGWIFYSAVNSVTPQIILNLGFETNAWDIAVRQLSYQIPSLTFSLVVTWWATRFKDLSKYNFQTKFLHPSSCVFAESPLVFTYVVFLITTICYANIRPSWNVPQLVFAVLAGIGTSGPLTLLVACIQFTAPHAFLSTATGLAFSARAIGGAFGSAVINAIINGRLNSHYASDVGSAATTAGLPTSSLPALLEGMEAGSFADVPGVNDMIIRAALEASHWSYARAYRLGWWSVVPFVALAIASVACMSGVKDLMTEHVEATVERDVVDDQGKEKGLEGK
ncbi:MFS general substrate transporter [Paraphaeosphaeria sporulosa]|uniref:MFS general substrate transporter n=1 Tax=Paraphaeosphaeria sporulosa TaxID=1460663 RepID=A0A177C1I1_9PLEO|nr:MFS general substrate transporter [Paraphaeosphaeria sporulosa]OAG01644.1 MFS general substrate transporter [Paraphaeosphaeria sporulosa]